MNNSDKRVYFAVNGVERVEFECDCGKGYFRYDPTLKRIPVHNQIPHSCNACGKRAYFTIPYPAIRYKNRIFADSLTLSGFVDLDEES
ncbi:hypothetical protein F0238_21210 [Vibrio coralliilyticus]|uniref:Uncharacterized protein n=1 Tax=Vibrio coralliilyticus TaxID=190893 RepID=A0AAP6ZUE8_9VIBR|nr:hypothetical protein [Vibrio coralliilyticus]NOJ25247.1 hypothetical protein [Vibrio coralliilyticus]